MKFSIIIINYNTFDYTRNCLESIFEKIESNDFEVIVIDNASSDGSGEKLKKLFGEKARFIMNNQNDGFGKANNICARLAHGDNLLFLNSDVLVNNIDLKEIDSIFEKNKEIVILGLDLLLENRARQEYAFGNFLSLLNVLKRKSNSGLERSDYFEVDWVSGAALIIRRDLFEKIGGFDEKFFMYFEDMDICRRVKELGYKIWFLKNYSVTHFGGKSSTDIGKQKEVYYTSQDYYFKKYYGAFAFMIAKVLRNIYLLFKTK